MKFSNKIRLMTVAVLAALTNYLCGCSAVGLGIGTAIDRKHPEYNIIESHQLQSIKPGKDIVLHLEDGSLRRGKYSDSTKGKSINAKISCKDTVLTVKDQMLIIKSPCISDSIKQNESIPLDSISFIEVKNTREAKHFGFMTGLIIDLALIYWLSTIDLYLPL